MDKWTVFFVNERMVAFSDMVQEELLSASQLYAALDSSKPIFVHEVPKSVAQDNYDAAPVGSAGAYAALRVLAACYTTTDEREARTYVRDSRVNKGRNNSFLRLVVGSGGT